MTAILPHFRFLECLHRHKSRNCDKAKLRCSAAKKFALQRDCGAGLMSATRPETNAADRDLKCGTTQREQNFVHLCYAREQFPSCVRTSAISDCQQSPLRYDGLLCVIFV
jgi:hypothetical protein